MPVQNIVAIDLPGHGLSTAPACLSLDGLLERMVAFLTCMGFYRVNLVGYSLGGALALTFANRFPDRVKRISVISCGNRFIVPHGLMSHLRPPAKITKAVEVFSQAAFHPKTTSSFRRNIMKPLNAINPAVLAADFHISRNFRADFPERNLKSPLLIIGGADDQISPPRALRLLTTISNDSRVEVIPDAGHMVIYENTTQVRDLLVDFLKH